MPARSNEDRHAGGAWSLSDCTGHADAETGVVLVEDEESRLGDLPIELPLPAAHGCCHVVVSFLPAAEPAAAPSFIPELPRPLRSALPEARLLVFGIYRPPLFS